MSSVGDSQIDDSEIPALEEESEAIDIEDNGQSKEEQEKLIIQQSEKDLTCGTYIFTDEDHTLGNSLRYMIAKRNDIQLCGYSIPHPSEQVLNMRIQTLGKDSTQILHEGLQSLAYACSRIQNQFIEALEKYNQSQEQ